MEYRQLLKLAQGTQENDTSVKSYPVQIKSSRGVEPGKIEMWLVMRKGNQIILADKNGKIEVPNSTALYAENPLFVTNQPRGSLKILSTISTAAFESPKIVGGKITYNELFKSIIKSNHEVRRVDKQFGQEGRPEFVLVIKTNEEIKFIRKMKNNESKEIVGIRTYKPHNQHIVLAFDELISKAGGDSIVEIPGAAKFSRLLVSPEKAKQIRQTFYDDPESKKNPVIIPEIKSK